MYRRAILGLGYLPQETSIFRGMTVEQNIGAVLELAEPDRIARERRLDELLDEFGLTRLRDSAAMALSGGERRRAEIARAGGEPVDHASRRALRGHRSIVDQRHPRPRRRPQDARHRGADHRP